MGWSEGNHQQLLASRKGQHGRTLLGRDVGGVGELLPAERDVSCRSWWEKNVGSFPMPNMKGNWQKQRGVVIGLELWC